MKPPFPHPRHLRHLRRPRKRRWGLRRRLTAVFAFVALAAVFITSGFTLNAVFEVLFANNPAALQGPWWGNWMHGDAPARQAFSKVVGTAFSAGVFSVLLAALVAAVVTQLIIFPLSALTKAARRLEAGERGIRLKVYPTRDEFQSLTEAFNNLILGLERQEAWRKGLIADIAHDLRTPLAVLRSEIEAMQDGVAHLDQVGLERLHSQVMLLSKLVNDLRTLSLAEGGGLELKKQAVELGGFLEGVVEAFKPTAAAAGMGLSLQVSGAPKLWLDPTQITRVMHNLLDNAVRYGQGPIEIQAQSESGWALIAVRDHGQGIAEEALERVFERFYKADASRTRQPGHGGTGLGLSIARALSEVHGGRLEAHNHPQGGAVFSLYLPL